MSEVTPGATPTPAVTPTATVNPPATPQGATPTTPAASVINQDTAARINELESNLASANARIRELNAESKKHRLAAESATGLADTERAELEAYRAYGKPEELKTRLDAGESAITERDTMKREATVREACELAGIDYKDFSTRKGVDDWGFEFKEEAKDGKTVKVPYATFKNGDKDESKPLAEKAFSEFPTLAKAGVQQSTRVAPPIMAPPSSGDGKVSTEEEARRAQGALYAGTNF